MRRELRARGLARLLHPQRVEVLDMGKAFASGELATRVFWIVIVGVLLEVAAMLLITA